MMETINQTQQRDLVSKYSINHFHDIIIKLFQKRDKTPEEIRDFMSWDLKELPSLTTIKDLDKGSERIIQAIKNNEKIGVYGDYDVDGTTSCAFLFHFFRFFDLVVDLFQPDRFEDGYGLHLSSINKALDKSIKVLITVDCGITNHDAANYAKERGLDLIITDHHHDGAGDNYPNAYAVINPNRRDEPQDSPLKKLAGVGVAFTLALKIKQNFEQDPKNKKLPSLYELLPFLAIGSLCDLVPLNEVNLKLVRHGLKEIKNRKFPGIDVFFSPQDFRGRIIDSDHVGFKIGPMINSKGRLESPQEALQLLTTLDRRMARTHYLILEDSNKRRKGIQSQVFKEAKEKVIKSITKDGLDIIIVYKHDWHEGVVGIVASKLVENFKVPAIVLTDSDQEGVIKGSARTAGELSIYELLASCQHLYKKFGGHKAAAGLSFPKENLTEITNQLETKIKEFPEIMRKNQIKYDLEVSFDEMTPKLLYDLKLLGPFGNGNEYPIFCMKDALISSYQILSGTHVKFTLASKKSPSKTLKGISFFYMDKWGALSPEELINRQSSEILTIFFQLKSEYWKGSEFLGLHIQNIMASF